LWLLATGMSLAPYFSPPPCIDGDGPVCFRPGSQRFIVLFSNSSMHNGPPDGTTSAYSATLLPTTPPVPDYPATIAALLAAGIHVICIDGSAAGPGTVTDQLLAVARDTETLLAGVPASYEIDMTAGAADVAVILDVIDALVP
jgi:hypothetical protein